MSESTPGKAKQQRSVAPERAGKLAEDATPGVLYIVATPIGNLEDITLRALRVLREADVIACEDTRHTQKLLHHYDVRARRVSYHQHNESTRANELISELEKGAQVALVTDAGMPGISDPGAQLISLAIEQQIPVVPVPGPSAFLTALVASGLPAESFCFNGFLPPKRNQRRKVLEGIVSSTTTQVFYEAPHRMMDALEDIAEVLGRSRRLVLAREVTKIHEEFLRGTAEELLAIARGRELKGEITLLIGGAEPAEKQPEQQTPASVAQRVQQIISAEGLDEKSALKRVARELGISKSAAYREMQRSKS